jgi:hypothetical protein
VNYVVNYCPSIIEEELVLAKSGCCPWTLQAQNIHPCWWTLKIIERLVLNDISTCRTIPNHFQVLSLLLERMMMPKE